MTEKSIVFACPAPHRSLIATSPGVRDRPRAARTPSLPFPFLPPAQSARGWSTERRTSLPSCRVPVAKNAGASRRSTAASIRRPGRAFGSALGVPFGSFGAPPLTGRQAFRAYGPAEPTTVSQLLAGSLSAAGRSPGAARCRGYEPRQQAPHPPRVMQRPAGRPSRGEGDGNI